MLEKRLGEKMELFEGRIGQSNRWREEQGKVLTATKRGGEKCMKGNPKGRVYVELGDWRKIECCKGERRGYTSDTKECKPKLLIHNGLLSSIFTLSLSCLSRLLSPLLFIFSPFPHFLYL